MRDFDSEWEDFLGEVAKTIEDDYLKAIKIPTGLDKPYLTVRHNCIFLAGWIDGLLFLAENPVWDVEHGEDSLRDELYETLGEEKYDELWAKLEPVMERY